MNSKLLSLLFILSVLSINVFSQTYFSEDFSSGDLGQFNATDSDGDGDNWQAIDFATGNGEGFVASSASWTSTAGALNPDNWLISPSIDLSAATGNIQLDWKVMAQDQAWVSENYSVYVATANGLSDFTSSSTSFTEILTTSNGYMNRTLDVSSFAGSSVYLGFRHHNCSDWFRMNLDDITVKTISADNASISDITIPQFVTSGTVNITGEITNNGGNNITAMDITWTDGTNTNIDNLTGLNIASGATYNFNHSASLTVAGGNNYDIDITVDLANDGDLSDNSTTASVSGLSFLPNKVTVGEEKTGEWCGWCPRGAVAMADMASSNPNDFIGIAIHNGDAMAVSAYDNNIGNYIPGGYPGGGVDRVLDGDPSNFLSMHNQRKNAIVPGEVYAEGTYDANTVYANISAKFAASFSGDYRLAAVLIADSIQGAGQANYYSGGQSGNMAMPNSGSMPGLNFATAGQTVSPFYHDHVAMALGDNEINGKSGSLPSSINANDSLYYTYTFNRSSNWNLDNFHIVGMLIDGSTGEILNAGKGNVSFGGGVGISDLQTEKVNLNVFPNPVNHKAFITFNCPKSENVSIDIVNSIGQVLKTEKLGFINGEQKLSIDASDLSSGIYFVKLNIDNNFFTKRINIIK
jgi:hypothetical protein